MSNSKNITEFRSLVEDLAKNKTNQLEPNGGPIEAGIVISQILKSSSKSVVLYTPMLDNNLYENSEFLLSLETYLKRENTEFTLIYDSNDDLEYCFQLASILETHENKVKKVITTRKVYSKGLEVSFMIGDDTYSRIEKDISNHTAIFNFGDPNVVKNIKSIIPQLN